MWNIFMWLPKKWPEMVVKWATHTVVAFICTQSIHTLYTIDFPTMSRMKFDSYVLWPLAKWVQNWIVDKSTAMNFMVHLPKILMLWNRLQLETMHSQKLQAMNIFGSYTDLTYSWLGEKRYIPRHFIYPLDKPITKYEY